MKRRYFIHVLVILVLVASLLIVFTSGALGKYTNVGLGVFSTLAFVNFSNYDVVGGVIVDDEINDNNTITPGGNTSGSLWGPEGDIDEGSHDNGYGWEDADDVSFVVTNESEEDIYLTFVVRMAIPDLRLTSFRFNYTIDAISTIDGTTIRYPKNDNVDGTLYTSTSDEQTDKDVYQYVFDRVKDEEGKDIDLYHTGTWPFDYTYYLEEVEIDTSIVLRSGESYQCHLHFSIPNGISSWIAQLFADGAAYYSIAIKAREEL